MEKNNISADMDKAAAAATADISAEDLAQFVTVGKWVQKWYLKAGYKRLGRTLMELAKVRVHQEAVAEVVKDMEAGAE